MLIEFEVEESCDNPYRSSRLNSEGKDRFSAMMRNAIKSGSITTLTSDLANPPLWNRTESYTKKGNQFGKKISPKYYAKALAHTEFTTWYTRGFARRLLEEKINSCEIYRAEMTQNQRCECTGLEGKIVQVKKVYDGHRAKYHPSKNSLAFSIPSGVNCHHTIKRVTT